MVQRESLQKLVSEWLFVSWLESQQHRIGLPEKVWTLVQWSHQAERRVQRKRPGWSTG